KTPFYFSYPLNSRPLHDPNVVGSHVADGRLTQGRRQADKTSGRMSIKGFPREQQIACPQMGLLLLSCHFEAIPRDIHGISKRSMNISIMRGIHFWRKIVDSFLRSNVASR